MEIIYWIYSCIKGIDTETSQEEHMFKINSLLFSGGGAPDATNWFIGGGSLL